MNTSMHALGLDPLDHPAPIEMNPGKFYALIKLARSIDKETYLQLDLFVKSLEQLCKEIDVQAEGLAKVNNDYLAEVRNTTRRRNPFGDGGSGNDHLSDLRHTVSGQNFLRVIFDVVQLIQRGFGSVYETARGVR